MHNYLYSAQAQAQGSEQVWEKGKTWAKWQGEQEEMLTKMAKAGKGWDLHFHGALRDVLRGKFLSGGGGGIRIDVL